MQLPGLNGLEVGEKLVDDGRLVRFVGEREPEFRGCCGGPAKRTEQPCKGVVSMTDRFARRRSALGMSQPTAISFFSGAACLRPRGGRDAPSAPVLSRCAFGPHPPGLQRCVSSLRRRRHTTSTRERRARPRTGRRSQYASAIEGDHATRAAHPQNERALPSGGRERRRPPGGAPVLRRAPTVGSRPRLDTRGASGAERNGFSPIGSADGDAEHVPPRSGVPACPGQETVFGLSGCPCRGSNGNDDGNGDSVSRCTGGAEPRTDGSALPAPLTEASRQGVTRPAQTARRHDAKHVPPGLPWLCSPRWSCGARGRPCGLLPVASASPAGACFLPRRGALSRAWRPATGGPPGRPNEDIHV